MHKKPMKILYISYDGAKEPIPQSQVFPYLKQFSSNGFSIHWLSFDKKTSFGSRDEKLVFKKALKRDGIDWYSLVYHKKPTFLAKLYDMLQGAFFVSYIVLKEKIDIIHGRAEIPSIIALFIKKMFRIKFIYDRRGFMAEDYIEGGMWKDRNSPFYKIALYFDRKLLVESDKVVVLTKKIKDILAGTMPEFINKIMIIPCCVDLKRFNLHDNKQIFSDLNIQNKFIFLYLGSLGTWYMLNDMLDFFKFAKEVIPDAHFLILTLSDRNIVDMAIKRKDLDPRCFTVMSVSTDRIHQYIPNVKAALVFIKPVFSKLASSPTKFAEALASGIPVIINYGIGDTDELIRNEKVGVVVEGFNEEAYKKAIKELKGLLENESNGLLQKKCRTVAAKYFSLEKGAAKYMQIYTEIFTKT